MGRHHAMEAEVLGNRKPRLAPRELREKLEITLNVYKFSSQEDPLVHLGPRLRGQPQWWGSAWSTPEKPQPKAFSA